MIRRKGLQRKRPLHRASRLVAKSAIRKLNPARRRKRRKRYAQFLRSPQWRAIRKAALARARHCCERCDRAFIIGDAGLQPTVHHKTYARFGGDEQPEDLEALCKRCHDIHHGRDVLWRSRHSGQGS